MNNFKIQSEMGETHTQYLIKHSCSYSD